MQKKLIIIFIFILLIFQIFCKEKVIVLDIDSKSVESGILYNLKEEILLIIEKKSNLNLLKISDINQIESEVFNVNPDEITEKYQDKIKKKLKTKYIIMSNLELVNEKYYLYLKLIDINTSNILFMLKFEEKSINKIKNNLSILSLNIKKIDNKKNNKKNLVILEVKSKKINEIVMNIFYSELLYYFVKSEKYNIFERNSLDKIFTAANVYSITVGKKKIVPIEAGEMEKSELALLGNINNFGEKFILNYRIINIENGESIISNSVSVFYLNELSEILSKQFN